MKYLEKKKQNKTKTRFRSCIPAVPNSPLSSLGNDFNFVNHQSCGKSGMFILAGGISSRGQQTGQQPGLLFANCLYQCLPHIFDNRGSLFDTSKDMYTESLEKSLYGQLSVDMHTDCLGKSFFWLALCGHTQTLFGGLSSVDTQSSPDQRTLKRKKQQQAPFIYSLRNNSAYHCLEMGDWMKTRVAYCRRQMVATSSADISGHAELAQGQTSCQNEANQTPHLRTIKERWLISPSA